MVPVVLPLPGSGRCAGLPLPLLLVGLVCRKSVLLRVLQVCSGSCLVVSGNFRVLTMEMVGRNLVLVRMVLPDCCCFLGTFLRSGLGSVFCCSQGS